MNADQLVEDWPVRWPRPDAYTTKNCASQVRKFGRDFAGRPLTSITRDEFRRWAIENRGSARYVRCMLYDALDAGLVEENVAAAMRLPRRPARKIIVPATSELLALTSAAPGSFRRLITFSAYTGLREGEARALRWCDVSPEPWGLEGESPARGDISASINREERRKAPKTAASRRRIAIVGPARAAIAEEYRAGVDLGPEARIFPLTRTKRQAMWDRVRRDAGVNIRWHDLRHFAATWFLDNGATVDDVAVQLGCSVDEVRRTYGHPSPDAALDRLEGLVS